MTKLFDILKKLGINNVLEMGEPFSNLIHTFCMKGAFLCKTVINLIVQTKATNRVNYHDINDIFYYEPGGTSSKNLIHWMQIYSRQELAQYDYGKKLNMQIYGSEKPPKYDIEQWKNWKIPTYLTTTDADPFSVYDDVKIFTNKVNNNDIIQIKYLENYNHLDYLWAESANEDIYLDVLNFIQQSKS